MIAPLGRSRSGDDAAGPGEAALRWWRNDGGRLVPAEGLPLRADVLVLDLAVHDVDGDGFEDVYVATGGPGPEAIAADTLFLGGREGFVAAGERLGAERFGVTRRVAVERGGALLLLRGGLVPSDPPRVFRLRAAGS